MKEDEMKLLAHYLTSTGIEVTRTNLKLAQVLVLKNEPIATPKTYVDGITYKPHFMFSLINRIKEIDK